MSEYIIDLYSEEDRAEVKRIGFDSCTVNGYRIKAEVVRCMDCVHYKHNSFHRCDLYSIAHEVEPNGFCAWGERTPND